MKKDRARKIIATRSTKLIEANLRGSERIHRDMWLNGPEIDLRHKTSGSLWDRKRLHHYAPTPKRAVMTKRKWRGWR